MLVETDVETFLSVSRGGRQCSRECTILALVRNSLSGLWGKDMPRMNRVSSENEQSQRNELELGTLYRAALHTSGTKLPALIVGDP
jgi:hypothetical protein